MILDCAGLEPGPLEAKGVGMIIDCRVRETRPGVRGLSDSYSFLEKAIRQLGISAEIEFTENENIGDRFMLYKFSLHDSKSRIAAVRLIVDGHVPVRLIFTVARERLGELRPP